jgi:hypothetical protein
MMVEKESGKFEGNEFGSLWEVICEGNKVRRYVGRPRLQAEKLLLTIHRQIS